MSNSTPSTSIASDNGSDDCAIQENNHDVIDDFAANPSLDSEIPVNDRKRKKRRITFNFDEDKPSAFVDHPGRQEEDTELRYSKKVIVEDNGHGPNPASSCFDNDDELVVDESMATTLNGEDRSGSRGEVNGCKDKQGDTTRGESTGSGFRRVDLRIDTSTFSPREEDIPAPTWLGALKNAATNLSPGESLEKGFFGADEAPTRTEEADSHFHEEDAQEGPENHHQGEEADHENQAPASFCATTIMQDISSKLDEKLNNTRLVTKKLLQEMTVFVQSLESVDSNYNRIRELEVVESHRIDGVEPDVNNANGLVVASANGNCTLSGSGGNRLSHHQHRKHQDPREGAGDENNDADSAQHMSSEHHFRGHSSPSEHDLCPPPGSSNDHQPLMPMGHNYGCSKGNDDGMNGSDDSLRQSLA